MFGTVRLVDPEICMQLTDTSDGAVVEKSEHCYAIWNKTQRCEHCISQEVIRTRRAQTKVEAVGDKVFYVHAVCVEVDGTPYALELVSHIRMEDLRGDEFLLLFHDMPRNALKKKLESIRAAVESLEFPEYPGLRITVSIGCAHAVGPLADTVQKADQALYHAKAAKNRTVLYKEDLQ